MRVYANWAEAQNEIKRDLAEMGVVVRPKTMQDKNIEGNDDYETLELQNYSYILLNSNPKTISGVTQPWADEEFKERISPDFQNPGEAWKLREDVWNEFLHDGKMAYTYNERINAGNQLDKLIERLIEDPDSRQLWLSVWNPMIDIDNIGGISRVPCSLGYNFQYRDGQLNIHYVMRSTDFMTHFNNDVYLAAKLLQYVAVQADMKVGTLSHTAFSLHAYKKDMEGVF